MKKYILLFLMACACRHAQAGYNIGINLTILSRALKSYHPKEYCIKSLPILVGSLLLSYTEKNYSSTSHIQYFNRIANAIISCPYAIGVQILQYLTPRSMHGKVTWLCAFIINKKIIQACVLVILSKMLYKEIESSLQKTKRITKKPLDTKNAHSTVPSTRGPVHEPTKIDYENIIENLKKKITTLEHTIDDLKEDAEIQWRGRCTERRSLKKEIATLEGLLKEHFSKEGGI